MNTNNPLTAIEARWIVPVRPARQALENHVLLMQDGRIVDLCPVDVAYTKHQPTEIIKLPEQVLLPGLINLHSHAAMSLFRGLADDLALMDWLQNHIWPAEGQWVNADFVRDGTLLACAEMIRGGTTCFNDMYFFPLAAAAAAQQAGLRAAIGLVVMDFPTPYAQDADDYLAKAAQVAATLKNQPRTRCLLAPHAPYTVSDASFHKLRALAQGLDLRIHIHVHETAFEVTQALQQSGERPLARLDRLGILSDKTLAVHMTQLDDGDIARCAERGLHIAHCPQSNLKLASGIAPIARLLAQGVNVGVGTDGAASNNDLDMFEEMRNAALLAKISAQDATALPAWQALEMATINAATALGWDRDIGSLEPGKAADLIAVNLDHPATQPVYQVISQLVYAAGRDQVSEVWVDGEHLLKDGQFTRLDWPKIRQSAALWRQKIGRAAI